MGISTAARVTRRILVGLGSLLATLPSGAIVGSEVESLRRTPIVEAVERAMPCVVNIHGPKTVADDSREPQRRVNGMGTGIVIDERGYILTNFHVIDGVKPIQVTLSDNRSFTARMVARDIRTDLAIIRIKAEEALPIIPIGTSRDLMLGETVVAIGNAYGYHGTITRGMISALNRNVEVTDAQQYEDLIQTDASINPGNSGGPLLNIHGQMIGINVAVRVGADGIAFAIPSDRALDVAAKLLATEQTCGIWHGVEGRGVPNDGKWEFIVDHVQAKSPAEACGLHAGDRILTIGGIRVERQLDVERALLGLRPGTEARLQVIRQEQSLPVQLVVATVPATPVAQKADRLVWTRLGAKLTPLAKSSLPSAQRDYNGGLQVTAIRSDGPAARFGLQVGDILVGMQDWETVSLRDVEYVLNQLDQAAPKSVPFYVIRDQETRVGQLTLTRR